MTQAFTSDHRDINWEMRESRCAQARSHWLCLHKVGGMFAQSCVVEERISQSTKYLWNICDCLTRELRGMHILVQSGNFTAHHEWIQSYSYGYITHGFFLKLKKKPTYINPGFAEPFWGQIDILEKRLGSLPPSMAASAAFPQYKLLIHLFVSVVFSWAHRT